MSFYLFVFWSLSYYNFLFFLIFCLFCYLFAFLSFCFFSSPHHGWQKRVVGINKQFGETLRDVKTQRNRPIHPTYTNTLDELKMRGKNDVDKDSVDDSEDKIEEIYKENIGDLKMWREFFPARLILKRRRKRWKFLPSSIRELPLMAAILNLAASNPINAFPHLQIMMIMMMKMLMM